MFLACRFLEVILVATSSQKANKQHHYLPFSYPDHPGIVRMSHSSTTKDISPVKLDLAIFSLIQMLLVMSGIETNPGPEIEKREAGIDALQAVLISLRFALF